MGCKQRGAFCVIIVTVTHRIMNVKCHILNSNIFELPKIGTLFNMPRYEDISIAVLLVCCIIVSQTFAGNC